ncbi:hypothetical protein VTN77DRAFT_4435 [Rasamsonia byssochlamydoides]|uniref:uncharacterized protein n=1 Tax=Rasamsonia byssochlamydoides TaxID=89139 RepID=UPI00374227C3
MLFLLFPAGKHYRFKLYLIFVSLIFAAFLVSLNGSIVSTATPSITNEFNAISDIGWYGSAYLLATCSLQPLMGKFYTHFPAKIVIMTAISIFELGSLLCGVARSSNFFIVGRAVAGIGSSGIINGALNIMVASVSLEKRPMINAINFAISATGNVIGPLIGGALTQHVSWRWCFYINLPFGGLTLLLLFFIRVRDTRPETNRNLDLVTTLRRIDILGCALFVPATVMFLLAFEWAGTKYGWGSATIIGLFCGSAATICIFGLWQRRMGENAMIPLSLLFKREVLFSCCTALLQMGTLLLFSYFLPLWFQVVKGASPTMSGVMNLPTMLSQTLLLLLSVSKIGYYTPFAVVGSSLTAIGAGLLSTLTPSSHARKWIGYQIFIGVGRGMVLQVPVTAVQAVIRKDQLPLGSALVMFCSYFGSALFVSLGETILINRLKPALGQYLPDVSPESVIRAGATNARSVVPASDLPGLILAYNQAITQAWYLSAGGSSLAALTSLGMGWKNIKAKKKDTLET